MLFLHVASFDLLAVVGVYGRWGFAEPNNRNGYQRCAALDKTVDLKFVDERCERTLGFICDIRECYYLLSEKYCCETVCDDSRTSTTKSYRKTALRYK